MSKTNESGCKLFIVTYDLDSFSDDRGMRNRLLDFFKENGAICLTQSSWLIQTNGNYTSEWLFIDIKNVISPEAEFDSILDGRLFVAEITGRVYYENLICDDDRDNVSIDDLISESSTVTDGWDGSDDE